MAFGKAALQRAEISVMAWLLLILALIGLALLELRWRARLARAEERFHRETEALRSAHQQEMEAKNAQERALFDSMVEGLLVLDKDGLIRLTNKAFARMFETHADLYGKTLIEAVRLHELVELAERLRVEKQIEGCELKLSGERWVGVSGAALATPEGSQRGALLVFHDLTRIKKLERTRQEFVANVSHELRTPLSLIKGYAETLLSGAKDNPDVALKFLATIDRNADRLRLLIEDLLTLSELESNRMRLDLQPAAARMITAKVLGDLASPAEAAGIRLMNNVPAVDVLADPARLEQVLVNLVDNGVKYGRAGGTVEVVARPAENGMIEFTVNDDGAGIHKEALERIFERFYREDKARSRQKGGTGLGLAIVKHIIQNHGGRVWAESEPGRGSSFHFVLPHAESSNSQ